MIAEQILLTTARNIRNRNIAITYRNTVDLATVLSEKQETISEEDTEQISHQCFRGAGLTCLLVMCSSLDLLSGALVAFCRSLESWPG